ncbi:MAG: hypothetical protein WBV55_10010 [Candidatus Sulfotelmatobacter sp.]
MRTNQALGVSILGMFLMSLAMWGQSVPAAEKPFPVPTDWSHHHVIFSRPATAKQAASAQQDPRYWQQLYRRELPIFSPARTADQDSSADAFAHATATGSGKNPALNQDWQENMGSGANVGAGNYPAKFSFLGTTANCGNATQPDFVVYSTGLAGSSTQASIVAYDNLYSGCLAGAVPSVYWAYNTGGQILTSPVFSGSGSQVGFVQTLGGQAGLVLLKWKSSTSESAALPGTPALVTAAAYPTCVAPCMTEVFLHDGFSNPLGDTTSSAFYDYTNDIAWVGGTLGWLHKITPVFNGVPAEVRAGGFPVQVANTTFLSSPVYDRISKNVFIGSAGGYFYRVNSTSAGVTVSGQLDFGAGLVDGPVLDPLNGFVYVFSSSDGSTNCGGVACSAVYQLSTTFAANSTGTEVTVGNSVALDSSPNPSPLYAGAFDNAYYSSVNATGNLYVCGDTGANPTVYRIPIQAGAPGIAASLAVLTPGARSPACSPVTDIFNPNASGGAAERLFFSVENYAHPTACAAKGCILNFVDTPWQASTAYVVGQEILVLRPANNNLYINVVTVAGTSGTTPPATWPATAGGLTTNGGVTWVNQGATSVTLGSWAANNAYTKNTRIIDGNGEVEIVTVAGTSAGAAPIWRTVPGATTTDGGVTWTNAGVSPYAALAAAGGTSGTIIDNVVGSGTLAGASQVYFSTLSNQTCTTSGTTGGCAVQASQSALK